eukprot:199454_1
MNLLSQRYIISIGCILASLITACIYAWDGLLPYFVSYPIYFNNITMQMQSANINATYFVSNNIQSIFNKYVDEFSYSLKNGILSHNNHNLINISNYLFQAISKQFIITALSNKTILLFGDSFAGNLASYIIHAIYLCIENDIDKFKQNRKICSTFCDHLQQKPNSRKSLILSQCDIRMISNRDNLGTVLRSFKTSFHPGQRQFLIHFNKSNITISVYYMWATMFNRQNPVKEIIYDLQQLNKNNSYDIIINDLLIGHVVSKDRCKLGKNCNFGLKVVHELENIMINMTENKTTDQCFIFGPINPYFKYDNETIAWYGIINTLLNKLNESMNDLKQIAAPYFGKLFFEETYIKNNSVNLTLLNEEQMFVVNNCASNIINDSRVITEKKK